MKAPHNEVRLQELVWALLLLLFISPWAWAECPSDAENAAAARQAVADARQAEAAGELKLALSSYILARDYDCEDRSGVAGEALRRAVPVAQQLGEAARREGDLLFAYNYYELGGLFAAADAAMLERVSDPDTGIEALAEARAHFRRRIEPGFNRENRLQLAAAGAYVPRRENLAAVEATPAKAAKTLLTREAQWLTAEYLESYAQIARGRELNQPTAEQVARLDSRYPARYRQNRIDDSQSMLHLALLWSAEIKDARRQTITEQVRQRLIERGDQIISGYAHAPLMFMVAENYYSLAGAEERIAAMKLQARRQGDGERAAGNMGLALSFYLMADADDSAAALMQSMEAGDGTR